MAKPSRCTTRGPEKPRTFIEQLMRSGWPAHAFETDFLTRFKNDPHQTIGREFDVLDELFADVDVYVSDAALRTSTGGIDGEELRERARNVYTRLYDDRL